ncbi:MAG: pectate lyase [Ferruginibacter sp.]|nr:pectate lyase [Ferruginibacter sp.]MCC7379371.1 pectate lyase [Chitinophagaceae bacterium]
MSTRFYKIFFLITAFVFAGGWALAQKQIIVSQDGHANFKSIQEAINSLPADANEQRIILIKKGVYNEKIFIDKNFITLKGEDEKNTIISISLAREEWRCNHADDYGTATINLKGNDIVLENLTVINSYGNDYAKDKTITCANDSAKIKTISPKGHQMALRSFETTRLIVINCIFRAYGGDTVSPWNTTDGMFYFKDCVMEGGVDFYCPRGWALAEGCTFICHSKEAAIWHDGSLHESSKSVFLNCRFIGDAGYKLGRYHRDAQFYLLTCSFDKNMADADIYQRVANPPNKIQWGKRVYYFNCKKDDGNYVWLKNNLPPGFSINDYSTAWVYDYKWNPSVTIAKSEIKKQEKNGATSNSPVSDTQKNSSTDPIAENMLLYQRSNGGWPKHFQGDKKVDYNRVLTDAEKVELISGYAEGKDATIDNGATTKEIRYLAKAYTATKNENYLRAANRGVEYLLKAQYANGGWPQFYPDFSSYRSQVTYNDNAMINALEVLYDVVHKKNGLDVINGINVNRCIDAIDRGIQCILKTQLKQNGKLTAWCAQYNAKTLQPEMARKFELVSLSGMETVGIVKFLMKIDKPSPAIIKSITAAMEWFEKVKITGYKFVEVAAPNEKSGKDNVLVPDSNSVIWARFYDIDTNEPFFTGRDSERHKTIAEVENERRIGYAWYGTWPAKLIEKDYPRWKLKWGIN